MQQKVYMRQLDKIRKEERNENLSEEQMSTVNTNSRKEIHNKEECESYQWKTSKTAQTEGLFRKIHPRQFMPWLSWVLLFGARGIVLQASTTAQTEGLFRRKQWRHEKEDRTHAALFAVFLIPTEKKWKMIRRRNQINDIDWYQSFSDPSRCLLSFISPPSGPEGETGEGEIFPFLLHCYDLKYNHILPWYRIRHLWWSLLFLFVLLLLLCLDVYGRVNRPSWLAPFISPRNYSNVVTKLTSAFWHGFYPGLSRLSRVCVHSTLCHSNRVCFTSLRILRSLVRFHSFQHCLLVRDLAGKGRLKSRDGLFLFPVSVVIFSFLPPFSLINHCSKRKERSIWCCLRSCTFCR